MTTFVQHRQLSAGTYPNYADEADPSWEEVVAMVVIPGNPSGIYEAAGQWDLLLSRVRQVQTAIDELKSGLEAWEGEAGDTYRNHLGEISGQITEVLNKSNGLPGALRTAADHVANTLNNTPIPDELVQEALDARDRFLSTGELDHRFHNGYFFDHLLPSFMGPARDILSAGLGILDALPGLGAIRDKASDMLRDFLSDGDDQAKAAYRSLSGQHQGTAGTISTLGLHASGPEATTITPSMPPTGTLPPAAGPGTGSMASLGGAGGAPGVDPSEWNNTIGTGLAGAGGGGPIAVGGPSAGSGGLGGIGSGVGGGGGVSAAGAGGIGGVGVTPGARPGGVTSAASAIRAGAGGVPMMGAAGAAAGRGGGVRGSGTGGAAGAGRGIGGAPMMGGMGGGAGARGAGAGKGAGGGPPGVASRVAGGAAGATGRGTVGGMAPGGPAGAGGEGTDHSTWLNEDEDVWGVDSDAPPPVVG